MVIDYVLEESKNRKWGTRFENKPMPKSDVRKNTNINLA